MTIGTLGIHEFNINNFTTLKQSSKSAIFRKQTGELCVRSSCQTEASHSNTEWPWITIQLWLLTLLCYFVFTAHKITHQV